MPPSFTGDRTSSYNGYFRFRIRNDDNYRGRPHVKPASSTFRLFPQILLIGNHRIELEHIPMEVYEDGKYKVRLHESSWRNRVTSQIALTRKQMMVALQNVQAAYIRATYNDMTRGDSISISELSLDVAVPEGGSETGVESPLAIGVEQCETCHDGYESLRLDNAMPQC